MPIYFVDSSALVKRYISESGSNWILELFNPAASNEIFVAAVTAVEIVAAIARRVRSGSIYVNDATAVYSQLKSDLQTDYQIIEITEKVIDTGMSLAETRGLRGYDAIQLAAGCVINELAVASGLSALTFVSADHELNAAAMNEGLLVENPNNYL